MPRHTLLYTQRIILRALAFFSLHLLLRDLLNSIHYIQSFFLIWVQWQKFYDRKKESLLPTRILRNIIQHTSQAPSVGYSIKSASVGQGSILLFLFRGLRRYLSREAGYFWKCSTKKIEIRIQALCSTFHLTKKLISVEPKKKKSSSYSCNGITRSDEFMMMVIH